MTTPRLEEKKPAVNATFSATNFKKWLADRGMFAIKKGSSFYIGYSICPEHPDAPIFEKFCAHYKLPEIRETVDTYYHCIRLTEMQIRELYTALHGEAESKEDAIIIHSLAVAFKVKETEAEYKLLKDDDKKQQWFSTFSKKLIRDVFENIKSNPRRMRHIELNPSLNYDDLKYISRNMTRWFSGENSVDWHNAMKNTLFSEFQDSNYWVILDSNAVCVLRARWNTMKTQFSILETEYSATEMTNLLNNLPYIHGESKQHERLISFLLKTGLCIAEEKKEDITDSKDDHEIIAENLFCYVKDRNKDDLELHDSLVDLFLNMNKIIVKGTRHHISFKTYIKLIIDNPHNTPITDEHFIIFKKLCRLIKIYYPSSFEILEKIIDTYIRSPKKIRTAALTLTHPQAFKPKKNFLLESNILESKIFGGIFTFLPRGPNYFDKFLTTSKSTRERELAKHKERKDNQDFDNYSIVAASAFQLLSSFEIPESWLKSFTVGPARSGETWSLAEQLSTIERNGKLIHLITFAGIKYIFTSIPTFRGQHSTPVVFAVESKKAYCLDPRLNEIRYASPFEKSDIPAEAKMISSQEEAVTRLQEAIASVKFLEGFSIILPCDGLIPVQSSDDLLNCGVHCAMIIAGIILHIENLRLKENLKNIRRYPEEILIDVERGIGIYNKDHLVDKFIVILKLALKDYALRKVDDRPEPLGLGIEDERKTPAPT